MIMSHQAKAEEENRVDMKNSELSATNDLSSVYRWGTKTKEYYSFNKNKTNSLRENIEAQK